MALSIRAAGVRVEGKPLSWANSSIVTDVAALRRERDLVVLGSGALVRSLLRQRLIDELVLLIHPLVLGSGRRLFGDDPLDLELAASEPTTTGVLIATYRPAAA
jgi:dihydrofolate reductase